MQKKLYFRLGLFVTIALMLFVGVLFYLGLAEKLAPRIKMVTTFSESVQGLTVGAAVKLMGVPIGTVDSLTILTKEQLIRVDMSINPDIFIQPDSPLHSGEHIDLVRSLLEDSAKNGLQCCLEMAGVTGLRYVEMGVFSEAEKRKEPLPEIAVEPGVIFVPSTPSTFSNIIDSMGEALTKIAQIDFPRLASTLDQDLDELQSLLSDPALKNSLANISKITTNLETTSKSISENITGPEIRKLIDNANNMMVEVHTLSRQLQAKVAPLDTQRLADETADTMQAARLMMKELKKTGNDFEYTMQQLNSFLATTEEFIDYLKRDPNSLLRGKSAEPVQQR